MRFNDDAATKLIWLALRTITANPGRAANNGKTARPARDTLRKPVHAGGTLRGLNHEVFDPAGAPVAVWQGPVFDVRQQLGSSTEFQIFLRNTVTTLRSNYRNRQTSQLPAPQGIRMKHLAAILLLIPFVADAMPPRGALTVSGSTAAVCSQLGEIAYWAATAHLAKPDKRRLSEAREDALKPNKLRSAISSKLVESAESAGVTSHGNAGEGLSSLVAARKDGILAAMDVHRKCLEGSYGLESEPHWTPVARSVEAVLLYDKESMRVTGRGGTLWTLTNFSAIEIIDGKSHRSSKAQFEFDCQSERYRVLGTIFYAEVGGKGKVTATTSQPEQWSPVAPQTMARRLMGISCGR